MKGVVYFMLFGAVLAQPFITDPVCETDEECPGDATCNMVAPNPQGITDLYFCNQPICDPLAPSRVDGACNNLVDGRRFFGATREQQIRMGVRSEATLNGPTALDVSDVFFNSFVPTPNSFGMANTLIIFGQFVDHDITLIDLVAESRVVTGTGSIRTMTFPLSERVGEDADIDTPMFSNAISAYLDLTQVYGGDEMRLTALRATSGGRMRSQIVDGQEFLPFNAQLPGGPISMAMGNIPNTFAAGDIRANEQVILTAYHTLFLREHNRLADLFTAQGMNNEDAFNAARRMNIAQYQNIVFSEFLPGLLGGDLKTPYSGYNNNVSAEVTLEFSTSLYRLGHSGVANTVRAVDSSDVVTERTLADVFFAPQQFLDTTDAVGALLLGSKQTCHERMDAEMQDSLRRLLFDNVADEPADLGALNVERARDHQTSSYNDVRAFLNLPANSLNSISSLQCRRSDLSSMFIDVEQVPIFTATLLEDPMGNSQLGETLTTALIEQFTRFRDGDRFYFENRNVDGPGFTDDEITAIRGTKLSDIVTANTFVTADQIGVNAFESEQCCSRGGNSSPNTMCVRLPGGVQQMVVDLCDIEDMTSTGAAFYPGTTDPATNTFYDCDCVAANVQVTGGSTTLSASAAVAIASLVVVFA